MASNPFFSARIPQNLHDHIENWRKETGKSKTDVLINALAKYTGFDLSNETPATPPIQEKLEEIFRRLDALENKKITSDNKKDSVLAFSRDNETITNNDNFQILPGKEAIELLGITHGTLSYWKTNKLLPKQKNGYEIDFMPEISAPRKQKWKVITLDN